MHRAGVDEGLDPSAGAIDQLIGHDEVAGAHGGPESADGAGGKDLPDAEGRQRPEIRPVVDSVGWIFMVRPVTRKERHRSSAKLTHPNRRAGLPVRGLDIALGRVRQERVEAAPADDGDVDAFTCGHEPTVAASGSQTRREVLTVRSRAAR